MSETGTVSKDTADAACRCPYCAMAALRRTHTGLYHGLNRNHGPFDFYECASCGSGTTYPLPSAESLNALYETYTNGLPAENRAAMGTDDGEIWHATCVSRIAALGHLTAPLKSHFSWIDAGAGAGEMARRMASAFPNSSGLAVDRHTRPADLPPSVAWLQIDLNQPDFHEKIGRKADVVYATAVWAVLHSRGTFVDAVAARRRDLPPTLLRCRKAHPRACRSAPDAPDLLAILHRQPARLAIRPFDSARSAYSHAGRRTGKLCYRRLRPRYWSIIA
jgi:hypothetical protein